MSRTPSWASQLSSLSDIPDISDSDSDVGGCEINYGKILEEKISYWIENPTPEIWESSAVFAQYLIELNDGIHAGDTPLLMRVVLGINKIFYNDLKNSADESELQEYNFLKNVYQSLVALGADEHCKDKLGVEICDLLPQDATGSRLAI